MTAQGEDILAWLDTAITWTEAEAAETWSLWNLRKTAWPLAPEVSPEAVLRYCAADRKILELHRPNGADCSVCADVEMYDEDTEGGGVWTRSAVPFPCPTVRAVAEGYGWPEGE